jgi:hypothetical protein
MHLKQLHFFAFTPISQINMELKMIPYDLKS